MHHSRHRFIWMLGMLLCAPLWVSTAHGAAPSERIKGTVASLQGTRLLLTSADGAAVTLQLSDATKVVGMSKASLENIAPGLFVGTAAAPDAQGNLVAQEVHIFPESMRGTGEGHRPYRGDAKSTMTNATVASVSPASTAGARAGSMTNATVSAAAPAGTARRLTLTYKDGDKPGQQVVLVPPSAPVVMLRPGDRALLVPGAHVMAFATRQADGTLAASALYAGENGLVPPM